MGRNADDGCILLPAPREALCSSLTALPYSRFPDHASTTPRPRAIQAPSRRHAASRRHLALLHRLQTGATPSRAQEKRAGCRDLYHLRLSSLRVHPCTNADKDMQESWCRSATMLVPWIARAQPERDLSAMASITPRPHTISKHAEERKRRKRRTRAQSGHGCI